MTNKIKESDFGLWGIMLNAQTTKHKFRITHIQYGASSKSREYIGVNHPMFKSLCLFNKADFNNDVALTTINLEPYKDLLK